MGKRHHNKPPKKASKPNPNDIRAVDIRARVIKALNNDRFIARTIEGISKEAAVNRNIVIRSIKSDKELHKQLKILPRKTSDGRVLITTKEHFNKSASFKDKFIDVFATKRVTVDDIS